MIFYLSGTGNTRWAAKRIADTIGERLIDITKAEECDCIPALGSDERIGFCFPVHGWRPPLAMRKFIKTLNIADAQRHYCYAVCTAGDTVGEAVKILRNDLGTVGIHLHSAFSLLMPESYVGLPFMDVDTPEKEKRKKQQAATDLTRYIKMISERQKGIEQLTIGRWPRINSRLIGGYFAKHMITDKPFRVTADKCIGCKACAKACPTGNIVFNASQLPAWQHNGECLACFSCYHHCPTHAIEYGGMTKRKGQYYYDKG